MIDTVFLSFDWNKQFIVPASTFFTSVLLRNLLNLAFVPTIAIVQKYSQ